MRPQKDRVIIDTNLWISFLLTGNFTKLDSILSENTVTLIFSNELIEEFLAVTSLPKFRKYFSKTDVESLLLKIYDRAVFVLVSSTVIACRDEKDNFLLALALDSNATHLITGDKDLLVLENYEKTRIVRISEYLEAK